MTMEMTSELIPEIILELTGDQAKISDPDGCPLTLMAKLAWHSIMQSTQNRCSTGELGPPGATRGWRDNMRWKSC